MLMHSEWLLGVYRVLHSHRLSRFDHGGQCRTRFWPASGF